MTKVKKKKYFCRFECISSIEMGQVQWEKSNRCIFLHKSSLKCLCWMWWDRLWQCQTTCRCSQFAGDWLSELVGGERLPMVSFHWSYSIGISLQSGEELLWEDKFFSGLLRYSGRSEFSSTGKENYSPVEEFLGRETSAANRFSINYHPAFQQWNSEMLFHGSCIFVVLLFEELNCREQNKVNSSKWKQDHIGPINEITRTQRFGNPINHRTEKRAKGKNLFPFNKIFVFTKKSSWSKSIWKVSLNIFLSPVQSENKK